MALFTRTMGKRQLVLLLEFLVLLFAIGMMASYVFAPYPLSMEELAGIDTALRPSWWMTRERALFQLQNPDAFWLLGQWLAVFVSGIWSRLPGLFAMIGIWVVLSLFTGRFLGKGWQLVATFALATSPLCFPVYAQLTPKSMAALFLLLAFLCEFSSDKKKETVGTVSFAFSSLVAVFLTPLSWPVVLVLIGIRCRRLYRRKVYTQTFLSGLPLLLMVYYWNLFASHWSVLSSKVMWGATLATPSQLVQDLGQYFLYGYCGMIPFGGGILVVILLILCLFSGCFAGWKSSIEEPRIQDTLQIIKKALVVVGLSFFLLWTVGRIGLASVYAPKEFCSLLAPVWILVVVASARIMYHQLSISNRETMIILSLLVSMVMMTNCLVQRGLYRAYNEPAKSLTELNTITSQFDNELFILPERLSPFVQGAFQSPLRSVNEFGDGRACTLLDVSARFISRTPREVWLLTQFPKTPDEEYHGITRLAWDNKAGFHLFDLSEEGSKHLSDYLENDPWPPIAPWDGKRVDSLAAPHLQLVLHGWSTPEFGGWASCWTSRDEVTVLFDKPLLKGTYRLHIVGFRHEYPWPETTLKLVLPGVFEIDKTLTPGGITMTQTVEIPRDMDVPHLKMTHPTWIPSLYIENSQDNRRLGILFQGAWFEAVER